MSEAAQSKSVMETTTLDLWLDVTEAAALGETAKVAVTVHLPDPGTLRDSPVVCFGKPGGGYSRQYYTINLPGPAQGAQSQWHADRGWIFVAVDHLGVGESSNHNGPKLDFKSVPAASQSAEEQILKRLQDGTLLSGYPSVSNPLKIGIGQSMGGCMTVVQQGRYHMYDGIAVLGYSVVHTHPPIKFGSAPLVVPWWPRDQVGDIPLRHSPLPKTSGLDRAKYEDNNPDSGVAMSWAFHYDDVDPDFVAYDLSRFDRPVTEVATQVTTKCPPWGSLTISAHVAQLCLTPGSIAPEAAAVMVPVLVAMGERDVIADPKSEGRAYQSATSVDLLFVREWAICTILLALGSSFGVVLKSGQNGSVKVRR
jgi:alpha-beta hydrolase superfamily lysophospholipase